MKNKFIRIIRTIYPKSNLTAIITIMIGLLLPAMLVNADQAFLFSDDFSAQFDIDQSQTSAKFASGKFYTADDSVSSAVVSKVIANPFKAIISARLDISESLSSGTRIVYYLSNNNGLRWMQINPGFTYTFDSVGNELRWRAIIARESPLITSAHIDNVYITYTVSDSFIPTSSQRPNNSSVNTILYGNGGDVHSLVCNVLTSIGLGCGASPQQRIPFQTYGQTPVQMTPASIPRDTPQEQTRQQANIGSNYLQASIANVAVKRTASDDEVILVKVPVPTSSRILDSYRIGTNNNIRPTLGLSTNDAIFEIIKGQKHFIPAVDIFFDYGFDLSMVQNISQKDLEAFPRAKLVKVNGDKKRIYYITEGYMIRLIPNQKIFESYGDREEDVIIISKKEFNFYPRNQYVFLENPLSADVFQIVNDGSKRYVVSQVMRRLGMKQDQIAPINQAQLDAYQNGQPIIF